MHRTSKYDKQLRNEIIDVYDVLEAFKVSCPASQHAIKKLLMPGIRGHKSRIEDLKEAAHSVERAIRLEEDRLAFSSVDSTEKGISDDQHDNSSVRGT